MSSKRKCVCVIRHATSEAQREKLREFLEHAEKNGLTLQVMIAQAQLAPCPRLRKAA